MFLLLSTFPLVYSTCTDNVLQYLYFTLVLTNVLGPMPGPWPHAWTVHLMSSIRIFYVPYIVKFITNGKSLLDVHVHVHVYTEFIV